MARAWIDWLGGHWGRIAFTTTDLEALRYTVTEQRTGWTDPETRRMESVLEITDPADPDNPRRFPQTSWDTHADTSY